MKPEEAKNIISQYLKTLNSESTIRSYANALREYLFFVVSSETLLFSNSRKSIVNYRNHLIGRGDASKTINSKLRALKSFFKWAKLNDFVSEVPIGSEDLLLDSIREGYKQKINYNQAKMLLNSIDTSELVGSSHRLLFSLVGYLGLKRNEVAQLKIGDFIEEIDRLIVVRRNKKIAFLLGKEISYEIKDYLEKLRSIKGNISKVEYLYQTAHTKGKRSVDGSTIFRAASKYSLDNKNTIRPEDFRFALIPYNKRNWYDEEINYYGAIQQNRKDGENISEFEHREYTSSLSYFSPVTRDQSSHMAEFYKVVFCIESDLRLILLKKIKENPNWVSQFISPEIVSNANRAMKRERNEGVFIRTGGIVEFLTLGELIPIIEKSPKEFQEYFVDIKGFLKILIRFNMFRSVIAHSGLILNKDVGSFDGLVKDYTKFKVKR